MPNSRATKRHLSGSAAESPSKPAFQRKPLAERLEKFRSELIPEGWYDATVTSVDFLVAKTTDSKGWSMQLLLSDKLYAGRVYLQSYDQMTKSRDVLRERFPGVDFDDSGDIQDALLGEVVRVHVVVDEADGQYKARNRAVSIAPKTALA